MATKTTEWEVRPLDEYGDTIDVEFYDSLKAARSDKAALVEKYPAADDWLFERHEQWHEFDGELVNEKYTELNW